MFHCIGYVCIFPHLFHLYIHIFFSLIHSLVRGHLDGFHIWPIVNSAIVDMEVQLALWDPDFNLQSFLYNISFSHRESGIDLRYHPTSFCIHKNTEAQRTWITTGSQSNWIRIRFSRSDSTDKRRPCPLLSVEWRRSPRTVVGEDLVSWWAPWPHSVCGFFWGTQMGLLHFSALKLDYFPLRTLPFYIRVFNQTYLHESWNMYYLFWAAVYLAKIGKF